MNLLHVWAWRPDVHASFMQARSALVGQTTLSPREIAVLNAATAAARSDSYCGIAWGTRLAKLADAETAGALLRGEPMQHLSARESELARWARQLTQNPGTVTAEDVDTLRAAKLSEREICDATLVVAFRLAFMTVNNALGAQPGRQLADEAPAAVGDSVTFGRRIDGQ